MSLYSFCSRVVNMWNSLPNKVVEVDTINIFKNSLDKYWTNQKVFHGFNADLTKTVDLPICIWMMRPTELMAADVSNDKVEFYVYQQQQQ